MLWSKFSKMICLSSASGGILPISKMINKRKEMNNAENLINKARTCGIKIINHGNDKNF
jgi:hypothetical protein